MNPRIVTPALFLMSFGVIVTQSAAADEQDRVMTAQEIVLLDIQRVKLDELKHRRSELVSKHSADHLQVKIVDQALKVLSRFARESDGFEGVVEAVQKDGMTIEIDVQGSDVRKGDLINIYRGHHFPQGPQWVGGAKVMEVGRGKVTALLEFKVVTPRSDDRVYQVPGQQLETTTDEGEASSSQQETE